MSKVNDVGSAVLDGDDSEATSYYKKLTKEVVDQKFDELVAKAFSENGVDPNGKSMGKGEVEVANGLTCKQAGDFFRAVF